MGRVERTRELARRRSRRDKLKKLRALYAAAKSDSTKSDLQEKAQLISPFVRLDES